MKRTSFCSFDLSFSYPFDRYLRYLTITETPDKEKTELIHKFTGFLIKDNTFYKNFKERMMRRHGEYAAKLMKGKCKEGSVDFKLGLAELEIDELYSVLNLGQAQFENTWGYEVGKFLIGFPEEVIVANIYRARGRTIDEILQILKDFFGTIKMDKDILKKYFYYFFETSHLAAHDLRSFIDGQDDELFKMKYELVFSKDEDKILFIFDQKKYTSLPEKLSAAEFYRADDKLKAVRNGKALPASFDRDVLAYLKGNIMIGTQIVNYNPLNAVPGNPNPPEIESNAHILEDNPAV